jgi:cell volume regulation protein A
VDPSELPSEILPALAVGLVLLLVARPLAVLASLIGFRIPWREQAFLSAAGLRGAVPIVLATFPIVHGVPDSDRLLNIVFVLVVTTRTGRVATERRLRAVSRRGPLAHWFDEYGDRD